MIIFLNNLKRMSKKKSNMFFLLLPIVFTAFYLMNSNAIEYRVGYIDNDDSFLSNIIIEMLNEKSEVIKVSNPQKEILDGSCDFIIVIPKEYEKRLLSGESVLVDSFYSKDNSLASFPASNTELYINAITELVSVSNDEDHFHRMISELLKINIETKTVMDIKNNKRQYSTIGGIGILIMSMLNFSQSVQYYLYRDKETGTYSRIMSSDISLFKYSFENIIGFLIIVILQVFVVMIVVKNLLKGDFGPNPFNVFIVLSIFAVVSVSLANLIYSLTSNSRQASVLTQLITVPLCMLGGCFWPIDIVPKAMEYISLFTPTRWVMQAVGRVIYGATLGDVIFELIVLSLFSLVMFIFSTSKKVVAIE